MRIGLVLPSTPAYSETFFTSKIKGLQEQGFSVVLLTQTRSNDFKLCPVVKAPKVYKNKVFQVIAMTWVFFKLLGNLKSAMRYVKLEKQGGTQSNRLIKKLYLNSHLLSQNLDWLHFGFATQVIDSELVAKAINAKMAVSLRGFDINVFPVKHPNCYNVLWKHVDKVHSISKDLLEKAYNLGLSRDIPHCIITPAVEISNVLKSDTSEKKHSKLQIVTVARLNWIKGLDHALNAMKLLKAKNVEFQYHIIGSGSFTEKERHIFQMHQNKLNEEVFFHGRLSHDNTLQKVASADIYLQPSIDEGFCNAVLEAQSLGVLCVVSDAGALPENVINGETGWIVKKRQPESIANKIVEIIGLSKSEKQRVSQSAKSRIQQNFNLKEQQKQFVDFYLADL